MLNLSSYLQILSAQPFSKLSPYSTVSFTLSLRYLGNQGEKRGRCCCTQKPEFLLFYANTWHVLSYSCFICYGGFTSNMSYSPCSISFSLSCSCIQQNLA